MKMLKIDLDWKPPDRWLKAWIETRIKMLKNLGHPAKRYDVFKTTRGLHIYFRLFDDVSDEEANFLQFLLGDDITRVKINQWRIKRGIKRWNKLFHKVLFRRKSKVLTCYYCGNKIPVPDKWFEKEVKK